ncbi:MAG: histidine phosphatase family protein [Spirosomataceae bacterium]
MVHYLYLVRHAEAEQPAGGFNDFYRTLTTQGLIDAARMGRLLKTKIEPVSRLISSPAERALMTSRVFAEQIGFNQETITFIEELYEGSPRNYLNAIHGISEDCQAAMLVGHNPGISYFAEYLTHEVLGNVPTAGVVGIAFEALTWTEVTGRKGKLLFYDSPEKLIGLDLK